MKMHIKGTTGRLAGFACLALAAACLLAPASRAQVQPPSILDETQTGTPPAGAFPPARSQPRPASAAPAAPVQPPRAATGGPPAPQAARPAAGVPPELDADKQARGELPPIRRSADPLLPLGQIQPAWSDPVAAPGQRSPGIMRVRYEADRVYAVRTRVQFATTINLPGCEQIQDIYVGDGYVFQVTQSRDNVVVIRPDLAGADTTLTIVSAANNTYSFYLRSEPVESKSVSDVTVFVDAPGLCRASAGSQVRATQFGANGEVAGVGRSRAGRGGTTSGGDFVREVSFDMSKVDFDCCRIYAETQADAAIAPVRVFSDDIYTYVDFGERSDRIASPAAFLLRDGIDQPVNTRVVGSRGQILVVEAIGDITLKSGERIICLRRIRADAGPPESVTFDPALGRKARRF